jgi:hypothetical protein
MFDICSHAYYNGKRLRGAGEMFRVTTLKKNIDENPQAIFLENQLISQ